MLTTLAPATPPTPTPTPPVVALTYEVTGADKSAFMIAAAGALSFKSDHNVNYEAKDEYSITIVASDDDAPEGVGTVDVTVNVTNAEDDGVVTPTQREPQIGKEVVVRLDDQDGDVRGQSWQWYRNALLTATMTQMRATSSA